MIWVMLSKRSDMLSTTWSRFDVSITDKKYKILNIHSTIGFNGWENIYIRSSTIDNISLNAYKISHLFPGTTRMRNCGWCAMQGIKTFWLHQGPLKAPYSWALTSGKFTMTLQSVQVKEEISTSPTWLFMHVLLRTLPVTTHSAYQCKSDAMELRIALPAVMNTIAEN